MSRVTELFGLNTSASANWVDIASRQECPFLERKCPKIRKSQPEISIGTCTVAYGKNNENVIICPIRLLERRQVFVDCLHLLTLHEPGNELHIIPEISVPGGSIDYCLVSVKAGKLVDFVGIELQTLDTTGTVWPERQRFLREQGVHVQEEDTESSKMYGMNWKMTAKTILVQLHHKIQTFEGLNKHLVLIIQNHLFAYMRREFSFDHLENARLGDPMHFHVYTLNSRENLWRLDLVSRWSTDKEGIARCLGLQANPSVELEAIIGQLKSKISSATLFTIIAPPPAAESLVEKAEQSSDNEP